MGIMATTGNTIRLLLVLLLCPFHYQASSGTSFLVSALGGEKAFFTTPDFSTEVVHRQSVCDRYEAFQNGEVTLKDSLDGLSLNVLVGAYDGAYFNYDEINGIDPEYPGLAAELMDELAKRGKFTWRESFGIFQDPGGNWTEMLMWGIDTYDISVDWWATTIDRMNMGASFLREWYDSSIILIAKQEQREAEVSDEIELWNWARPYELSVWYVTLFTVILSGLVYQWLEYLQDERGDRSAWDWFSENFYLSATNFSQNFEYGTPASFASRVFCISMTLWGLVMTATYTANLASMLVDRKAPTLQVDSLDKAVAFEVPICTWEGTNSDNYLKANYPDAIRIPKLMPGDVYQGLQNGECKFAAEVVTGFLQKQKIREHNPDCDLVWVNEPQTIEKIGGGFASKADSGKLCSGLIRDVINLHMAEMIAEGWVEEAWEREYARSQDIDCSGWYNPEYVYDHEANNNNTNGRNLRLGAPLSQQHNNINHYSTGTPSLYYPRRRKQQQQQQQRMLKAGGNAAAASGAISASDESYASEQLTLNQMIGTFAFHWLLMGVAIAIAYFNIWYNKHWKNKKNHHDSQTTSTKPRQSATIANERQDSCMTTARDISWKTIMINDNNNNNNNARNGAVSSTTATKTNMDGAVSSTTATALQGQMRDMQIAMQQFQKQMLEEQQKLQQHVLSLTSAMEQKEHHVGDGESLGRGQYVEEEIYFDRED